MFFIRLFVHQYLVAPMTNDLFDLSERTKEFYYWSWNPNTAIFSFGKEWGNTCWLSSTCCYHHPPFFSKAFVPYMLGKLIGLTSLLPKFVSSCLERSHLGILSFETLWAQLLLQGNFAILSLDQIFATVTLSSNEY